MSTTDPFRELEQQLRVMNDDMGRQVKAWQKAHSACQASYNLVTTFNEERQPVLATGTYSALDSSFSSVSGASLLGMSKSVQYNSEPFTTAVSVKLLLSGIQSNVADYLSQVVPPFEATRELLQVQSVPLEDRLSSLRRRLEKLSGHSVRMLGAVEADLVNSTNPNALSNAATNLRELLTSFIHEVSCDEEIGFWKDVQKVDGRPTRRSRLEYFAFFNLPKSQWPASWASQISMRIAPLLESFGKLSKFTHLNAATAEQLGKARLVLDSFTNELILFLDAREEGLELLKDMLEAAINDELQEVALNDLQEDLERNVSHAYGPSVEDVDFDIDNVDISGVTFSGTFRVSCTFQVGSDGDVERGDGLQWEGSKTFRFTGSASSENLKTILIDAGVELVESIDEEETGLDDEDIHSDSGEESESEP